MTLLNRKIDYALLILCYLHHRPEGGSAREIAAHFGISRPFAANILKGLCHEGFVASHRGVTGGYQLREGAAQRALADLIDALDGPVVLADCNDTTAEGCCTLAARCPIRAPITDVHHRIRAVLEAVRLVEIFDPPAAAAPARPVQLDVSRCGSARPVG
jgi:Rrf2 family protein